MSKEGKLTGSQQATVRRLWLEEQRRSGVTVPVELWGLVPVETYLSGAHNEEVEKADLRGDIAEFIENKWPIIAPLIHHQATTPRASAPDNGPLRTYRKPFPDRLRFLAFIAPRIVPAPNLLRRSLDTGPRLPRGTWPEVAKAWNGAHPHSRHRPDDFRVFLANARRDNYLRESYFDGLFARWAGRVWGPEWKNPTLFKRLGLRLPEDRLKVLALTEDDTDTYIRERRERQEPTHSLPPLSDDYLRSKQYLDARRKQLERTRHLGKSKASAGAARPSRTSRRPR